MSNITSYLRYLREMSRKILMNKGFENVLYKKPKSQDPLYCAYPQLNLNYWRLAEERIAKAERAGATMRLFLGLGLCVGKVELARRSRNVAAPLLYAPVEIDEDDDSGDLAPVERWEDLTLNYDLLTVLLGNEQSEDLDDNSPPPSSALLELATKLYEDIVAIEREIENVASDSKSDLARRIFERLRQRLPALQTCEANTSFVVADESLDRALERFMQSRLTFFDHRFFFLAVVPDELTAYEELRKLLDEAER